LRIDYKFYGEINKNFVAKYKDPKVRRCFKNIARITGYPTIDEALKQIQNEERANYVNIMNMDERAQHTDVNRKYVFEQHRLALGLLKICGWANINDPKYLNKLLLADNLRRNEKSIVDTMPVICNEFMIKRTPLQLIIGNRDNDSRYIEILMKTINKVLFIMYGVRILPKTGEDDLYYIVHNRMFTTDPTVKDKPLIIGFKKTVVIND
jgi:hypothetical protein